MDQKLCRLQYKVFSDHAHMRGIWGYDMLSPGNIQECGHVYSSNGEKNKNYCPWRGRGRDSIPSSLSLIDMKIFFWAMDSFFLQMDEGTKDTSTGNIAGLEKGIGFWQKLS